MWVPIAASVAVVAGGIGAIHKYVLPAVALAPLPVKRATQNAVASSPFVGVWNTYAPPTAGSGGQPRSIPLAIFYPIASSTPVDKGVPSTPWLPHNNDVRYANGVAAYASMPEFLFRRMKVHTMAALTAPGGPIPIDQSALLQDRVILFSHGLGGHRNMYSSLCMSLAAAGYIVISPEHCDGSACFALPTVPHKDDNSIHAHVAIHYKKPPQLDPLVPHRDDEPPTNHKKTHADLQEESDLAFREKQLSYRLNDVSNIADAVRTKGLLNPLFAHNTPLALAFAQKASLQLVGHSFGGATALGAAAQAYLSFVGPGTSSGEEKYPTVGGMRLAGVCALDVWLWPTLSLVRRSLVNDALKVPIPFPIQFLDSEHWERWTENRDMLNEIIASVNSKHQSDPAQLSFQATRHVTMKTDHMAASDMGLFLVVPGIGRKKYVDPSQSRQAIANWASLISDQNPNPPSSSNP